MDATESRVPKSSKERRKLFSAEWKKKTPERTWTLADLLSEEQERILSVLRAKYREDTERRERIKKERLARKYRNDPARGIYHESGQKSYSTSAAKLLLDQMERLKTSEITPENTLAMVACARAIADLIRANAEIKSFYEYAGGLHCVRFHME